MCFLLAAAIVCCKSKTDANNAQAHKRVKLSKADAG